MTGRIAAAVIVIAGILAGFGMYYAQVYGFYDELEAQTVYAVATPNGELELAISAFQGIDAQSSPLRYRACFQIEGEVPELATYAAPTPLNAPGWFSCFDAAQIGADLEAETAQGVLVHANAPYGFDRVMALYPDGRAFVWPQINPCGQAHFDGDPLPAGCPLPPES